MERWSEELRRRAVMDRFNPSSVMGTPLPDSEESDIDGSQIPNSQQNVSRAGGGSSSQSPFVSTGLHGGPRPFMQQAPFMPPFYPPGMVAPSFFTPPALHMQSNGSSVVHRPQPRDDFPAPPPPAPNFVAEVHNVSVPVASNHRPQVHDFTQPDAAPSVQSTDPGSSNGAGSSQASRGKRKKTGPAKESSRITWKPEWVVILLELKHAEFIELESQTGRDMIITAEQKWRKIQSALASRGIVAETEKIRWKWDSLLAQYKSVKVYLRRTGAAPFESLSKAERKEEKLPMDFEPLWFDMIDCWYKTNPQVEPPCVADSSDPFAGLEVPQTPEEETDITDRETDDSVHGRPRSNSGVKCKTGPKTSQAITDCMGQFSGTLLEVEKCREGREERRLKLQEDMESKRIELDSRRIDIEDKRASDEAEREKELVGALTSVAAAISNLCAMKAQR